MQDCEKYCLCCGSGNIFISINVTKLPLLRDSSLSLSDTTQGKTYPVTKTGNPGDHLDGRGNRRGPSELHVEESSFV